MKRTRTLLRRILGGLAAALLLAVCAFVIYAGVYYRADPAALAALPDDLVVTASPGGRFTTLTPPQPNGTGLVFYPGAKVEANAYLPLLARFCEKGYTCVLVSMPLRFAFLDAGAADAAFNQSPGVARWYLAGHSLGGAMASAYMARHPGRFAGLILMGAYVYGDVPAERTLVLYGSADGLLNRSKLTGGSNEVCLEGGNHAQFGNYGAQKGDGIATISREEQQVLTVEKAAAFMAQAQDPQEGKE